MRYTLDKMSVPGWTFQTDHIHHVRRMLEGEVCGSCKMTQAEYDALPNKKDIEDLGLPESVNPYTYTDFFPENYNELSDDDKIGWLLNTACGCEYDFEDANDPRPTV